MPALLTPTTTADSVSTYVIPARVYTRGNIKRPRSCYDMMSAMHVRRFWLSGIVLAATLALLPFSFHAERHLETATRVEASQAETVRQELADRFRSPFVNQVVLVIKGIPRWIRRKARKRSTPS